VKNEPLLVGLDIGSTNIKAVVFEANGHIVARASQKTPTHFPRPGWAYYDPAELWETTASVLRAATAQLDNPARVASVGVASVGETGVLLDAHGMPLYEMIAWYDVRSEAQGERLATLLGAERVYATTGLTPQAIFSLCKLVWIQENAPDQFARAVRWLHVADYITWKLCGEAATDYSVASRTMALDLANRRWAVDLIHDAGIDPALFAPLAQGGSPLAKVSQVAAAETGLPVQALVAVGGHDHLCGAMAVGAATPGQLLDSIGTAEALVLTIDKPLRGEHVAAQGYEQGAHVVDGYYGMGAYRTAGICIDWFRQIAGGVDYATLTEEALAAPVGSLGVRFVPQMRLPHSPSNDPRARGVFIGLSTDVTRGMMFRAILEGLSFETRNALEPLLEYAGYAHPSEIFVIGGVCRNRLFVEIKAAILNQPLILANVEEEVATGAALLGGIGAGIYPNAPAAAAALHVTRTVIAPDAAMAEKYDAIFRNVYQDIYGATRPLHHANAALIEN
jgi:xylulokinase